NEADPAIRVWHVSTKKVVIRFALPDDLRRGGDDVRSAVFSPDGKVAALVVNGSRLIALWNVEKGTEIRRLAQTAREIFAIAFSPDGKWLAAGNWDGMTRVYEVETGKELCRLVGHQSHVNAVRFSPDGKTLATGSSDTTVLLWELSQFSPERHPAK